ncbi:hypothetical protein [Enterobacter roggenkampii]|uniref:hypothetical protein n=1 Tax=Enterobacter roggenkampii TaxID=1812935 RepID=UPI0012FF874B|nr:hypothetical protein [Enterobacter roggenkampii]QWZ75367.1 hypothetical protein I6L60_23015 [Enterobacter roggenkampii]
MKDGNVKAIVFYFIELIKSIDTWKKLWFTVFISLFFGMIIVVYPYRNDLFLWFLERSQEPILNNKEVPEEVISLDKDLNPDAIAIWVFERKENIRVLRYMFVNGTRVPDSEGMSNIILVPYIAATDILVELINEGVGCFQSSDVFHELMPISNLKINYFCAASIPPRYGVGTGVIIVGYKVEPPNNSFIRQRLRMSADRLISK